jgi:hypothetical protein
MVKNDDGLYEGNTVDDPEIMKEMMKNNDGKG